MLSFVLLGFDTAQAQTPQSTDHYNYQSARFNFFQMKSNHKPSRVAFRLMPAGTYSNAANSRFSLAATTNPVTGSGFAGRIAKWTGVFGSNTFVLGNSAIAEDKFGKVGIGTNAPTSPLTVAGLIETVSPGGGIKFPDGTIQTTSATGALFSVAHDGTLTGNGTTGSPLGAAVPLFLTGAIDGSGILNVQNNAGGLALIARGGNVDSQQGGRGVFARGGASNSDVGGNGVDAIGGSSGNSHGGTGVSALGGTSASGSGGEGVNARGGFSESNQGGAGVMALGGGSNGDGGNGVDARGGNGSSNNGGDGAIAVGGNSTLSKGGRGLRAAAGSGPLGDGLAGDFLGDVEVSGMLSKGGGSFKIDHPLDPENRYLYHSFVESPDMKNIYDGNIVTDANGEATVEMPDYFEALNKDFRYQLTVIGTFAQAIVAEKIKGNRFLIRTNAPNVEVSWQVTGIRQDGWANKNRIRVEVEKTERERGYYLHPEAFDQSEELSIVWARHPEMMKQRKDAREQFKRKHQ